MRKNLKTLQKTSDITLSSNDFNILFIESFRYALFREPTGATIDKAEQCIEYWDAINKSFQEQIHYAINDALEFNKFKEHDTIEAWKKVLALKVKENYI